MPVLLSKTRQACLFYACLNNGCRSYHACLSSGFVLIRKASCFFIPSAIEYLYTFKRRIQVIKFSVLRNVSVILIMMTMLCTSAVASQKGDLLGEVSSEALLAEFPAFMSEYSTYEPSEEELNAVAALEGNQLVILFGTWCHDSEREVPRLLKTLDVSGLDAPDFTLIAVDRTKRDPEGMAKKHSLKYTPTFILLRDGEEIGRVVERADAGLTQDLKAFVEVAQ